MKALTWDNVGERLYEVGVSNVVLYPFNTTTNKYDTGVAWNGVSAVNESPSGAEATPIYANNKKYLNLFSNEEYAATIEAYCSPEEFDECDGCKKPAKGVRIRQQARKPFGLCYRTEVGNDSEQEAYGYVLHLIYGCMASPSEREHGTINESPEVNPLSWEVSTTPIEVEGFKPTSVLEIDSTIVDDDAKMAALEEMLYGVTGPEFSDAKTYAVGDIVTHTETAVSKVYKCTTAVTVAGEWDSSDWTEITNPAPHLPSPAEVIDLMGIAG